ncbi:Gfo/Idh/MocA family oxidoreductase [Streptomyces sp. H27-H1]|uniref:Gfo/Idh/MocA family protein n=1 Tax=Streptomyces sp. H27-H1 TaxID=2996461 RepID=UPI00226DE1B9|nr:Gfo/Idh/MocA family oxidoreductase [Streptomyces sp. H27-H1]MCY0928785.1 Gfo/Idh/MocA family oxidoreductase [Streptomyces sp. H27-H1]
MRIGLIGTGRIGSFHAAALARQADASSLLLADADPSRAARLADRLGATAAPTVEQIFTWGVDAVVVSCATEGHADLVVRAVRAGLPVFCEKPIAPDLNRTLSVLREVAAVGGVLQLGFMRRFDEGYTTARELVRSGALGRLHTVRTTTADPSPPSAAYLATSGGLYRDCLVHDFDMVRWVTGHEVSEVYATGSDAGPAQFQETGDIATAAAVLTLDDGTLVSSTGTRCNGAGYDVRMELAGELDQVSTGLDDRTPIASTEPHGPPPATKPWPGFLERFAPAYEAELAAFVRLVRGEGPNPCDGVEALAALRVAEACERSRRERRRVGLEELPEL